MQICLNYYGQLRNITLTQSIFNKFIDTSNVTYHILYSTWNNENIEPFKKVFHNSYINQYDYPDFSNYKNITESYAVDPTNSGNYINEYPHVRTMNHCILGYYIKSMTDHTITKYESLHNINFDIIVTLRTDIYLNINISEFYNYIKENINDNVVFVAYDPEFAVFPNQPAVADSIFIANRLVTTKILKQIDLLQYCAVKNTNYIHPESALYNLFEYLGLNIIKLQFKGFSEPV